MSKGEHLGASVTALLCACSPSAHLVLTKEVLTTTYLPPRTYHHVLTRTDLRRRGRERAVWLGVEAVRVHSHRDATKGLVYSKCTVSVQ